MSKLPQAKCEACPLGDPRNIAVPAWVPEAPQVVIIGESPGNDEVYAKVPFVGKSGQLLRQMVRKCGLDDTTDILYTNAVACHPAIWMKLGQADYDEAAACCQPRLMAELASTKTLPRVALGRQPQRVLGITSQYRWTYPRTEELVAQGELLDAKRRTVSNTKLELADAIVLTEDQLLKLKVTMAGAASACDYIEQRIAKLSLETAEYGDPPTISVVHPAAVLRQPQDHAAFFIYGMKKALAPVPDIPQPCTAEVVFDVGELPAPDCKCFTEQEMIVVDLETDQVDWINDKVLLVGIGVARGGGDPRVNGVESWVLTQALAYSDEGKAWLKEFFEVNHTRIGGHNFKFDATFLKGQLGLDVEWEWDTILMAHAMDENWLLNLKTLAAYFCDAPPYEDETKRWLATKSDKWSKIPQVNLAWYLTQDIHYNLMLAWDLREWMGERYQRFHKNLSMPVSRELTKMELRGVIIDIEALAQEEELLDEEKAELALRMEEETNGMVTKPGSPKQCATFIYDYLRAPACRVAGLKPRSTNKAALDVLGDIHPAVATLRAYRRVQKMHSSYVRTIYDNLAWDYEFNLVRVHPQWLQFSVLSGRLSARKPAIQTIPHVDDDEAGMYGKRIRDLITVPPDYYLLSVDGSQWELRVIAAWSGDPFLISVYEKGGDIHTEVTEGGFGKNWTKQHRYDTKRFVFSLAYGGTIKSSAQVFQYPEDVKKRFVDWFYQNLTRFVEWRDEQFEYARSHAYIESRLGRRAHFPITVKSNHHDVRKGSVNYPIQGTASDITTLAQARVGDILRAEGVHPLISHHDAIIVETPKEKWQWAARILADALESTGAEFFPEVPWKAAAELGTRWGSLEEVEIE